MDSYCNLGLANNVMYEAESVGACWCRPFLCEHCIKTKLYTKERKQIGNRLIQFNIVKFTKLLPSLAQPPFIKEITGNRG